MDIRVALVDHHQIVREGLSALLRGEQGIEVIGQAGDGTAAVTLAEELQPHVMVMDVALPSLNGIEVTRRVHASCPGVKVVCLSMHDESRQVLAAMDAGAAGYVLKHRPYEELLHGIRTVVSGQTYLSPPLVRIFVDSYRTRQSVPHGAPTVLTPRERQLVQLVAEGYSTQQIADRLCISGKTVATHRENVLSKLKLRSIAQLTRYAIREGLSPLEMSTSLEASGEIELSVGVRSASVAGVRPLRASVQKRA